MPTSTPWGAAQSSHRYARGIVCYSTAGHGGFHVSPTVNQKIHPALRIKNGWYEEDCEWAFVALSFPHLFSPEEMEHAHSTGKNYFPDRYEQWYRNVNNQPTYSIPLEESRTKREIDFLSRHINEYIVVSAQTFYDKPGYVRCWAVRGGRGIDGRYASKDEKQFLVPEEEYDQRNEFGFVIDESKYEEIK